MQEFLNIILNFPTAMYTLLMGVVILYWITVILGAVDIDLFDLDAELDADVDVDVDVDVDADVGVNAEGDVGAVGAVVSVLEALGLVGVPLTISMSLLVFFNWCATFLGVYFLRQGGLEGGLLNAAVVVGSMLLSLGATSLTVRPLRPLFQSKSGARAADALVGHTVQVISGSVSPAQGRAQMALEGSTVNLSIRCEREDNGLKRGDEALIIGYDAARHLYMVEPMNAMLGRGAGSSAEGGVSLEQAFDALRAEQEEQQAEVAQVATSEASQKK